MSGIIFTCWKVREMPRRAIWRATAGRRSVWPRQRTAPPVSGSTPVIRLKVVDLPAPLGPIRPTMSPARIEKLTSFTATRPPNCLAHRLHLQQQLAARRLVARAAAAARRPSRARAAAPAASGRRSVHRPSGAYFSTSTSTMPKTMISKLPLVPISRGSSTCSWSSTRRTTAEPRKAPQTLPTPPSTAMNRYSMPLLMPKGDGLTLRWKMREQPARDGGQQRGDHEHDELVAEGRDAHRLGHRRAAA